MSIGAYNEGQTKEGQIRISPSGVKNLIYNRPFWIKQHILGMREINNKESLDLGTAMHHLFESYLLGKELSVSLPEAIEYLEMQGYSDTHEAHERLTKMFYMWKDNIHEFAEGEIKTEQWLEFEPNDKIKMSGTLDAMFGDTILDWKSSGTRKKSLDAYKHQLYLYAFIARQQGMIVNNVGAVVIKTPAKRTEPKGDEIFGSSAIDIIIEKIDEEFMDKFIKDLKESIKDIQFVIENQTILDWIKNTSIPDPYNRDFM